jgi:hypothetical protein
VASEEIPEVDHLVETKADRELEQKRKHWRNITKAVIRPDTWCGGDVKMTF